MSTTNVPMAALSPAMAISAARAFAVDKMPYFRAGIYELIPRETPGLGTFAVTKGSVLMYDPAVLKTWSASQAGTVTLHEYLHIFLNHPERLKKLFALGVLQPTKEDMELWNDCCDAEINDDLEAAGLELPSITKDDGSVGQPITPKLQGWPPHKLAEEYVQLALKERAKRPPGGGHGHGPACGHGHCGSGGGNPVPDEPAEDDADQRSEVDQQVSRKQVMESIKQASKSRGNVPLGLQRFVDEQLKPAHVPWQQKLSRATRAAVAFKKGSVDYTYRRPSRRQASFMGMQDAPILPGMHAPQAEVALVADTSGSMGEKEMRAVLEETNGVIKAMAGQRITFVSCDAAVHAVVRTGRISDVKLNMKGGGGTDFRPAFDALEKVRPRPDIVVFATDGYGPAPDRAPKGMQVIWLMIPGGRQSCPWGETIYMEQKDEERAAAEADE